MIERNKKDYYEAFSKSKKTNEITAWIIYFTQVILQAQQEAKT